jgi:hypothetical protein
MKTQTIDIEPTWTAICNGVQHGHFQADALLPACQVADIVRQAQKQGVKRLLFVFPDKNGKATIENLDKQEKLKLNGQYVYCNLCGSKEHEGTCYEQEFKMFCEKCAKKNGVKT